MKIAVIGWELPPAFSGGLGIHTVNMFSIIGYYRNVDLYVPDLCYSFPKYPFNVRKVKIEKGIDRSAYSRITDFYEAVMDYNEKVVDAFDPNGVKLVHCHDWITFPAGIAIKEKYGIPLIVTYHSTEFDRSAYFNPQEKIMKIEREGGKEADRIITVSNLTKSIVVEKYNIDPEKIVTVYNGVDATHYLSFPDVKKERNVLYFGRVTNQKGPKFFMETAKKVLEFDRTIRFTIAGTGELLGEMKSYAMDNDFFDHIEFPGFVHFRKAIWYYKRSSAFIIPAVSEPFGMTVLEAMVSGTPVILSRTTGVGEALHHVLSADFWDTDRMATYVVSILNHRGILETMSRYGKAEALGFTWDKAAAKTMEVYDSL
ncbi:RfbU related protein [Thermoplasma volcanium GSS1]|uniref:RfbU related protein n=1 Tax=Thermoplasma volcanium (strain ATCC 51530 / DSM 4299 / JCM 9571 / NBRC 15438 / GSS1) TaxID=273116 RepID=Q97BM5_THEVO|nr:glycosyltransferase family 4 protein [Thermoplasma volcanium]BAB59572.1 RfbU related protein [Thermoplasma volcanium GSS1]